MALSPDARRAIEYAAGAEPVFAEGYDIAAARHAAREAAAQQPRIEVARVVDVDAGGVPARLYVPEAAAPGVVVHAHGGGFVFNDVEVHDASCRRLAQRVGRPVLSVDYRLAPEHPFPAAVEDLDAVLAWLDAQPDLPGPVYGHGDSAGANLVLVAALRNPGRFAALALIYPFLDPTASTESARRETAGFDPREARWYWDQYTGGDATRFAEPDLAPLLSDRLGTLPPTFVMTAEHDPLRDEGELLVTRLADAGVEVLGVRYLGQIHGFWRHPDVFSAAAPLLRQAADFLRDH
ncbi:alpha/beta hydrolase [Nocardioides sp. GXZ039]|uniref:alpha/beta hydrolase n=1 Tax=Nocardioides sp. GXZ039 TaxID=3136018 RepID=UPI0030F3D6A9